MDSNIWQILEKEKHNDGHIRLYRVNRYWVAFERSAFNLFSVCNVDNIVKVKDVKEERESMMIAIVKCEILKLYNPQLTVLESSENEMLIGCRTTCRGFQHWKESVISMFTENLYPAIDDTSYNIQRLNLEMLLN
ncbi:hypothetical protein GGR21_001209 [Dysgonomonas hofstadii]|uniref:Uncharacterized protein n=1 Tax=Dysgonomonas hofstadii TaxID=637886 RepID=A0A840CH97_9BACT|nr:hypothetical protein [Dysgonomonas hofstadii]MBB4035320.1 hypothetical protein [Dysgonomonas hofstadii]